MTLQKWLSIADLEQLLGLSRVTIRKRIRNGLFPPAIVESKQVHKWTAQMVADYQERRSQERQVLAGMVATPKPLRPRGRPRKHPLPTVGA